MGISLQFLGAARNVTGSSHFLEVNGKRILIDCGLYQERELRARNWNPFPVDPKSVDFVLLTHAHLDHCGLLPKFCKEGFKGKIICTPPTEQMAKIILLDAAHIQEEDARSKKKRHEREGREGHYPEIPLYTREDAEKVFPLFESIEYEGPFKIDNSINISLHDAGHILGSAMIKIKVNSKDSEIIILFSGDVGHWNKPIIRDPSMFERADYIIVESTYGDRLHEDSSNIKDILSELINSTDKKGGNVVIPSFAVERTQELLYYLSELLHENKIPHLLTFVDSPMAISVTEVFENNEKYFDEDMLHRIHSDNPPFYFSTLKSTRSSEESKAINHIRSSCIIIAGSGMCTGGRIKHHLVHNISRPECTILFIGYQAKGTLGREILKKPKEVRIQGKMHQVKANIIQINGLSAHADQSELLRWLSGFKLPPRQLFIVHGENDASLKFADIIHERYTWNVSVPRYLDRFTLAQ